MAAITIKGSLRSPLGSRDGKGGDCFAVHRLLATATIVFMPVIKSAASPEIVEAIQKIEDRADKCYEPVALLDLHPSVAAWALMTRGVAMIEAEIEQRGDNSPELSATLINISRFAPIAMNWAAKHGSPTPTSAFRKWTFDLAITATQALDIATRYAHFVTCFPMWHKDRYLAELVSPELVRFTAPGTARNRQVSAYLKGLRPKTGRFQMHRPSKPATMPEINKALFQIAFDGARRTGPLSFEYADPKVLWGELLPEYTDRARGIARRSDDLLLGNYTLGEFNQVYGAFLSICAAHEYLCFAWGKSYGYPLESAVMVRSNESWASILSELSSIPPEKCSNIISDLTFNPGRSLDLHIHPFVPLQDDTGRSLAVAPQFPLHSRPDENILRVVSILRPALYDRTSNEKESESLAELKKRLPKRDLLGPILMPNPIPDIDLLVADEASSTVILAELKWMRKSLRPVEIIEKDAAVLNGVTQLKEIGAFLADHPDHLTGPGKLPRRVQDYAHVCWLVVARDHWPWMDLTDGIALVEFDAFAMALGADEDLHSAVEQLLTYDWLPLEASDFRIQYDGVTVNGVGQESEVFYSL